MTRLNAHVEPKNSLPLTAWERMDPAKKAELLSKGPSYIYIECFVYEPHPLIPTYTLKKSSKEGTKEWEIGHRLIDFKQIFRVECNLIERLREAPEGIKLLELTISVRSQLREKLAAFFARVPEEDAA